ncbi:hypothetical protein PIB30_108340, partial [Stylosanthes scabra]|nr:hypothetical protein [Stylosanthes scabra]
YIPALTIIFFTYRQKKSSGLETWMEQLQHYLRAARMATIRGKRLLSDVDQEESCDNNRRNTGNILVSLDPH